MHTIGQRIRNLRQTAQLTQAELATQLRVNRATLANWEVGRAEPDPDMLRRLADYFHVTVDYLVGRTDELPDEATAAQTTEQDVAPYLEQHPWLRRLRPDLQRDMLPVIDVGLISRVFGHGAPAGGFSALTDNQLTALCESLVDHFRREEELRKKLGLPFDIYKQP